MGIRININVADVLAEPNSHSERLSQALFNESLDVLKEGKKFSFVKLGQDDYKGYVRNSFFSDNDLQDDGEYMVSASIAIAYKEPDLNAPAVGILPFTSIVKANEKMDDFIQCETIRYGEIYLALDDLVQVNQKPKVTRESLPMFFESVKRFIGVPYLWGGKSFFGFDCSGLIQTNFRFFGIDLPRDTKDQIKAGTEIPRDRTKPGDLLFFTRHVALALTEKRFIHSNSSGGGVNMNSLDPADKNYRKDLDEDLITVRRVIED